MYCKICGYNLRDLNDEICPECGSCFDPHDKRTIRRKPISLKLKMMNRLFFLVLCAGTIVIFVFTLYQIAGYNLISSAYDDASIGENEEEIRDNLPWYLYVKKVAWSDVEPIYTNTGSVGTVYKCGFIDFYFYIVFENGVLIEKLPAHE